MSHAREPPYKSHPLYSLRRATIFTALVGFAFNLLSLVALGERDAVVLFIFSLVLLFLSLVYVLYDLFTWSNAQSTAAAPSHLESRSSEPLLPSTHPFRGPSTSSHSSSVQHLSDEVSYQWPSKRLVIFDFIFAFVLQWLFWAEFFTIIGMHGWYSNEKAGAETFEAYANLANFVASVLHAMAWWKELMARRKAAWLRDMETHGCVRCGRAVVEDDRIRGEDRATGVAGEDKPGPSKPSFLSTFGRSKIQLPRWTRAPQSPGVEHTNEPATADTLDENGKDEVDEPLLRTPDESSADVGEPSGYGTLIQSVESVGSVPETVVRNKDKGKKRMVDVE